MCRARFSSRRDEMASRRRPLKCGDLVGILIARPLGLTAVSGALDVPNAPDNGAKAKLGMSIVRREGAKLATHRGGSHHAIIFNRRMLFTALAPLRGVAHGVVATSGLHASVGENGASLPRLARAAAGASVAGAATWATDEWAIGTEPKARL